MSSDYFNDEVGLENNTFHNSVERGLNSTINGRLGYYSDTGKVDDCDWYKIKIEKPIIFDMSLIADPLLNIKISLVGSNGDIKIDKDYGKDKVLDINKALQAGEYYIKVELNDEGFGGYELTTATAILLYESDGEPNDSFQNANSLAVGNEAYGQIGFFDSEKRYDAQDWYIVEITDNSTSINLTPIDMTGNISLELLDITAKKFGF